MRLLADENIQAVTVHFLQGLGHDVQSVVGAGMKSADDDQVFTHAQAEGRILLTFNADFVDLRELARKDHCGVIRLRVGNQRAAYLHPILEKALACIDASDLRNTLVTLADRRTRVRKTSSP